MQVASKAFMTCDQSGHGYLTWSEATSHHLYDIFGWSLSLEVRSFISMIFRGLGCRATFTVRALSQQLLSQDWSTISPRATYTSCMLDLMRSLPSSGLATLS